MWLGIGKFTENFKNFKNKIGKDKIKQTSKFF